jgi:hypothetical protein
VRTRRKIWAFSFQAAHRPLPLVTWSWHISGTFFQYPGGRGLAPVCLLCQAQQKLKERVSYFLREVGYKVMTKDTLNQCTKRQLII